jgi:hypothetical protein
MKRAIVPTVSEIQALTIAVKDGIFAHNWMCHHWDNSVCEDGCEKKGLPRRVELYQQWTCGGDCKCGKRGTMRIVFSNGEGMIGCDVCAIEEGRDDVHVVTRIPKWNDRN